MTDMLLRDIPPEIHEAILRRAQEHGQTPEAEARSILKDAVLQERLGHILREQGLGSALHALGREFHITTEFDNLRAIDLPRYPTFE